MIQAFAFTAVRAALTLGVIAMTLVRPVQASVIYDFQMTRGAGGGDLGWSSQYLFVEVAENPSTLANDVLFKFTNEIPLPDPPTETPPEIARIYFDTGDYTDLFTDLSIETLSSGVTMAATDPPTGHPFFPTDFKWSFSFDYQFERVGSSPWGINPGGEYAMLSSVLGQGKTFDDVIDAMNQGLDYSDPSFAQAGLRIGLFTYHVTGGERDDAGHATYSLVTPVPLPAAFPMMLAGLGLMGLMGRRGMAG